MGQAELAQGVPAREQVRALEADSAAVVWEAAGPVVLALALAPAQALEVAKGLAEELAPAVEQVELGLGAKGPLASGCPRLLCFEAPPWAAPD